MMKQHNLTSEQIRESNFLYDLSNALSWCDLSKLDLKTLPGLHPAHSVLIDNYELNITRSPVFVHKNKFMQIMGFGDWKFQEGLYERYEIFVFENVQNMRAHDIARYSGKWPREVHNAIFQRGTMATDHGYFAATKQEMCDEGEELYFKQNAHLFMPAKQIYTTLNAEATRRQSGIKEHILSDINSPDALQIARMRMLNAVRQKQK